MAETAMGPRVYAETHWLLLYFENSDFDSRRPLEHLKRALGRYETTSVTYFGIPSEEPYAAAERAIFDFRTAYAHRENLLCVCFNGHGSLDLDESLLLCETGKFPCPAVEWSPLQLGLVKCISDVLIIMSCCHAGAAAPCYGRKIVSEGGKTEILGACCRGEKWFNGTSSSFMEALVWVLKNSATGTDYSGGSSGKPDVDSVTALELWWYIDSRVASRITKGERLRHADSKLPFYQYLSGDLLRPIGLMRKGEGKTKDLEDDEYVFRGSIWDGVEYHFGDSSDDDAGQKGGESGNGEEHDEEAALEAADGYESDWVSNVDEAEGEKRKRVETNSENEESEEPEDKVPLLCPTIRKVEAGESRQVAKKQKREHLNSAGEET